MLSGLTPPAPPGLALKAVHDLVIGVGRKLRHQHLDALIVGLEADEGFGAVEADQRRDADPDARRKNRVGGKRRAYG